MVKIKICGLRRDVDVEFVNEAMPDYIGFVFAKSKRQVTKEQAVRLKKHLDPKIKAVGVFVDEKEEVIAQIAREGIIDVIQLHGREDEGYIRRLKTMIKIPLIKAFQAQNIASSQMTGFDTEYYLLDSGKGSGKTFDWKVVPEMNRPWFLAGGLSEDNIEEAIRQLHPYGVDFSSGVETNGYKDRDKIINIVRRIRNVKR